MLLVPETVDRGRETKTTAKKEKNIDVAVFSFPFSLFFLVLLLFAIVRAECYIHNVNSSSFCHYLLVQHRRNEDQSTPTDRETTDHFCNSFFPLLAVYSIICLSANELRQNPNKLGRIRVMNIVLISEQQSVSFFVVFFFCFCCFPMRMTSELGCIIRQCQVVSLLVKCFFAFS